MARNQARIGSLVPWKTVKAMGDVRADSAGMQQLATRISQDSMLRTAET